MIFTNSFIRNIPRENSGSNTSNAYDFQKNWSLELLLDCHENKQDYLIVFDYHEDVVVFDSEANATRADFYQIKTKNQANWTIGDFTSRKKNVMSIFGKMYVNKSKFSCAITSANFVSNAPFKFSLGNISNKSNDSAVICGSDLSDDLKLKIREAIKKEHGLSDNDFEKILYFHVSEMDIRGHVNHAIGRLAIFLETRFPDKKCKPIPFYQALFSEVARKTDYGKNISEYAESLNKKALGKSEFEQKLKAISIKRDFTVLWAEAEATLRAEWMTAVALRNIRDEWDNLEFHLMDNTGAVLQQVFGFSKKLCTELRLDGRIMTLSEIIDTVFLAIKSKFTDLPCRYTDNYLKSVILAAFYE